MLRIYTSITGQFHACYYYRLVVPMRAMHALSLPVQIAVIRSEDQVQPEDEASRFFGADIVHLYHPVGSAGPRNAWRERMDMLQGFRPRRGIEGQWRWPASVVIDTDDDLFNVSPLNPAFRDIGVSVDGRPLQPNEAVHWVDGLGQDRVIYQEGQHGFSLANNLQRLAEWRTTLSECDAVTCTTPLCEEYVRENANPKRVFVSPNSIMLDDYPTYGGVELRKKDPSEVRILWQGSDSHHEDLASLRTAMQYLTHRYPQIKWVFFGALFDWIIRDIPSDRFEYHRWVDHRAYHLRLGTLAHDISIAPLTPHRFNRARSAIKWYESSVLKYPAATVAQRFGAFDLEIQDGQTGALYDTPEDFIQKVSWLVENPEDRARLAANAKDWVLENRDAMKTAPKLFEFYQRLREEKQVEMPPTPEDETPEEDPTDGGLPAEHTDVR